MKTIIIGEAGVNHNSSLEMAFKLVDVAVDAGVDIVKFQAAIPEEVVTKYVEKAEYQKQTTGENETQLAMTRKIHLPLEAFHKIRKYCESKMIQLLITTFDLTSTNYISRMDPLMFKIPSGEITNLLYLRQIGQYKKSVILSTGMSNLGEIESALEVLETAGTPQKNITVLHCNTEYPTPMEDVNLRAMLAIRDAFGVAVGYSDHTLGIEVPIAAVAMGATVIEKHFTLDRNLPGPDHQASLEPAELKAMVTAIRNIEVALGDGIKRPSPSEIKNINIVRKSLVAARNISAGDVFIESNLTVKRPGSGISPMRIEEVLGRISPRDIDLDELIEI